MKKYILSILSIFLLTLTACSSNESDSADVNPAATVFQVNTNATDKEISNKLKATPSSKEKNQKSSISAETYNKNTFAGYEGQLSFFYDKDGSILYYKWYINETDQSEAKEIYTNVCKALTGSYGDGEENNSEASGLYTTSFTNDKQQITAQLQKANGSGYEISYMVVG